MSYKSNVLNAANRDYGGCIGVDCGIDFRSYIKESEYYIVYAPDVRRIFSSGNYRICSGEYAKYGVFFRLYPYTKIYLSNVTSDGKILKCKERGENETIYYSYIISLSMTEFAELNKHLENGDRSEFIKSLNSIIKPIK